MSQPLDATTAAPGHISKEDTTRLIAVIAADDSDRLRSMLVGMGKGALRTAWDALQAAMQFNNSHCTQALFQSGVELWPESEDIIRGNPFSIVINNNSFATNELLGTPGLGTPDSIRLQKSICTAVHKNDHDWIYVRGKHLRDVGIAKSALELAFETGNRTTLDALLSIPCVNIEQRDVVDFGLLAINSGKLDMLDGLFKAVAKTENISLDDAAIDYGKITEGRKPWAKLLRMAAGRPDDVGLKMLDYLAGIHCDFISRQYGHAAVAAARANNTRGLRYLLDRDSDLDPKVAGECLIEFAKHNNPYGVHTMIDRLNEDDRMMYGYEAIKICLNAGDTTVVRFLANYLTTSKETETDQDGAPIPGIAPRRRPR
jgi:hypothetical protein